MSSNEILAIFARYEGKRIPNWDGMDGYVVIGVRCQDQSELVKVRNVLENHGYPGIIQRDGFIDKSVDAKNWFGGRMDYLFSIPIDRSAKVSIPEKKINLGEHPSKTFSVFAEMPGDYRAYAIHKAASIIGYWENRKSID